MDADFSEGMHMDGMQSVPMDNQIRRGMSGDEQRLSYASVTTNGSRSEGVRRDDSRLDPDAVEVLDEDCVIGNSGSFLTIEFSERVHSQIDRSMRNVIVVRLLERRIGYGVKSAHLPYVLR
ncbi:hypothetical protein V6N13_030676 [Hibiscus sabdariffa]|uniref:Uncharacterized protein n=1 Tax=Hibiscus sabdariffa TaxID=183260 RepID=A0ABR2D5X1_9ROSI